MKFHGILALMLAAGSLYAADLTGTYRGEAVPGKPATLVLKQQGQQLGGSFTAASGKVYTVEGNEEEGDLYGYLHGKGEKLYFEGFLEEGELYFDVMPLGPDNEPDEESVDEYVLLPGSTGRQEPARPALSAEGSASGSPVRKDPAPEASQQSGAFSGTYSGMIQQTPASLTLERKGTHVEGKVDAGGYIYELKGELRGDRAEGTMTDPQAGGSMKFEATESSGALSLTFTGQNAQAVTLRFQKGGSPETTAQNRESSSDNEERDPALVGAWYKQDTMTSGDASMVTRMNLTIYPDGTYVSGDSQVYAGGSDWSGKTSPGGSTRARWRTQNSVVYIMEAGSTQWQPYARYYVEGARMMFTFANGSREVWYRQ